MESFWKDILWAQTGAAIDMLENAIIACPEEIWSDRSRQPEFWYIAYHTIFFLDCYLSESLAGFAPPEPYNLDELDPTGILPERVYTKDELLSYLNHGREKCRAVIEGLTDETARQPSGIDWLRSITFAEVILITLRHLQHHAAQLNLILRQTTDSAPRWVGRAGNRRVGE